MQFTKSNWERFETYSKKTTIRNHELKAGVHKVASGMFKRRESLGKVYVHPYEKKCKVCELTEQDAKDDGFDSLCELLIELAHRNPNLTAYDYVYKQGVDKL